MRVCVCICVHMHTRTCKWIGVARVSDRWKAVESRGEEGTGEATGAWRSTLTHLNYIINSVVKDGVRLALL